MKDMMMAYLTLALFIGFVLGQWVQQQRMRYLLRRMVRDGKIRVHPDHQREDPCQWEWSHGKNFNPAHEEQLRHDIENGLDIL